MNHQIENNGDIGTAGVKLGKAIGLNEHRLDNIFLNSEECGIKAFNMSHLNNQFFSSCQFDQLFPFDNEGSNGFFNKDMLVTFQTLECYIEMFASSNCD